VLGLSLTSDEENSTEL